MTQFRGLGQAERFAFLSSLVNELQLNEALAVSSKISPRLKRDFLSDLPVELALHCVSFIDDPRTLVRAMRVCKYWHDLLQDERLWRDMHTRQLFRPKLSASYTPQPPPSAAHATTTQSNLEDRERERKAHSQRGSASSSSWAKRSLPKRSVPARSYREKFRDAYLTENNWLSGGRLLTMHSSMGDSVVTSLVVNEEFIVIGMANSKIHVFDATTGHYFQSLLGHELGVWALVLVSPHGRSRTAVPPKRQESVRRASFTDTRASAELSSDTLPVYRSTSSNGGERSPSSSRATKRLNSSDVCGAAASWGGIKRTLVVSGGCDREVRVWDIVTGEPVWTLQGHSSTIRCLKVLDGRPIAISGSRDFTLRVWDINRGRMLRVLEGHEQSVRCLEVAGNQVVSGSYDYTCRVSAAASYIS
jgi:F-box and WD-40 domain protein CDC4